MANLELALKKVLRWEGGFANDPDDAGGATMKGVTIGTYTEYCRRLGKPTPTVEDLKNITNAEILDLANLLYWSKIKGDQIKSQSIANLCFDSVWGSGTGYIKVIQKVLGVQADGIFGNITLNKMNSWTPQKQLFDLLWERRKKYFEGCSGAWKYLRGWLNRLNSFKFEDEEPAVSKPSVNVEKPKKEEPSISVLPTSEIEQKTDFENSQKIESSEEPQQAETKEVKESKKNFLTYIIELIKLLFKKK